MTDREPTYLKFNDPDITVEIEPEPETDYVGDRIMWMPPAGMQRGCIDMTDHFERQKKLRLEAIGISEELLTGSVDYGTSFSEHAYASRIEIHASHREAMNDTFKRVLRKTMAPKVFCKAVPGGAAVMGKRFRSLRLARVFYKTIFKNAQFKNIQSPIDPEWKPLD